ncbi:MAG: serine/threonine protein kinase [Schlesneria sp.]|nr:serine/threonine protein kinase [Schlesneria sp.]
MTNNHEPEDGRNPLHSNPNAWAQMVEAVNRLEAAWKLTRSPDLANFIPSEGDTCWEYIVAELIKVDQELHWRCGDKRLMESYLEVYPNLATNPTILRELLIAECSTRILFGEVPTEEELHSRFANVGFDVSAVVTKDDVECASLLSDDDIFNHQGQANPEDCHPTTASDGLPVKEQIGKSTSNPKSPLEVGQWFGRFQIRELLGYGSMGTVYRVFDPMLAREAALKTPHFDSVQTRQEFFEEAQKAAKIHHSHLCTIHDAGEIDGQPYIVLALIDGESLAAAWRRGLPSPDQAALVVIKIARALDCLHRADIIHRDIKPQNILLDRFGEPHLMDFGLASQTSSAPDGFIGTPAYMPPEQLVEGVIDARSDVYSLGVVLYEGLTGNRPFTGLPFEVMTRILRNDPASPQSLRADIDETLAAICLKAMAKSQHDRYQTAGEFAAALERRERPEAVSSVEPIRFLQGLIRRTTWGIGVLVVVLMTTWLVAPQYEKPRVDLKPLPIQAHGKVQSGESVALLPGADVSTAIPLDLGSMGRASAAGEVKRSSETQWFCVKSVHTGLLLIEALTLTDEFDGKMTVFDANMKEVAEDGNSGPANDSQVVFSVMQDSNFFVKISSTHQRLGPLLLVASQPASAPPREPFMPDGKIIEDSYADSAQQAHLFTLHEGHASVVGSISPVNDEDWLTFTPSDSGVILIRPETPNSSLDTVLELLCEDGLLCSHRQRMVSTVEAGKRYLIRIAGASDRRGFIATGNYVLRLRFLATDLVPPKRDPVSDSYEH